MEISIYLAQIWGGFFLIFGILFLVAKFLGRVIEMTKDKSFVISTGYTSLLMGLVTVVIHNVWTLDWRLVITVLGWSTLIKGMIKIGFPDYIHKQAQPFKKNQTLEAIMLIGLGVYLFAASLAAGHGWWPFN
ncbi:MAG: hypothetical protein ABIG32_02050 [Candidatus Uhrbacteria bacterium]|nr:hypothetical protein [Patescibacteria group bacterium]MBU1906617.1 hypothetical protein [Patescibacteria group bacterium]